MIMIEVNKATIKDVKNITNLHKKGIPSGFLSQQPDFLLVALYKYIIDNDILMVVRDGDGLVAGFVSATLTTESLYRRFFLRNIKVLVNYLSAQIFSYKTLKKAFETMFAPKKTKINETKDISAELLSIVVKPSSRSKGLGTLLINSLEKELRLKGVSAYKVVVGSKLESNNFYQRNGFVMYNEIQLHQGVISNIYIKELVIS